MLCLPTVSCIAISSIKIPETVSSLKQARDLINFKNVSLATDVEVADLPSGIELIRIPPVKSLNEYSRICFEDLHKLVDGDHILVVQHDGIVHDPKMWNDEFLEYDYIGAPWPYDPYSFMDEHGVVRRVGNGGLSLRSRRLYEFIEKENLKLTHIKGWYGEDVNFGVIYANLFEQNGLRIAPLEVSMRFAYETSIPEYTGGSSFGYHRHPPRSDSTAMSYPR